MPPAWVLAGNQDGDWQGQGSQPGASWAALLLQRQVASQKGDQSPAKTPAGAGITL